MKKILFLFSFLICLVSYPLLSLGQSYTTVTATLTDGSGQVWTNAAITAKFVSPFGNPAVPLNGGQPITDSPQFTVTNGSGQFTLTLDNNATTTPAGTRWDFIMCPNATVAVCSEGIVQVSGSSVDLSGSLSSYLTTPTVTAAPSVNRAYSDLEANGGIGGVYWRTSDNTMRGCIAFSSNTCSAWQAIGSGSNTPPGTNTQVIFNNSNAYGAASGLTYNTSTTTTTATNLVIGSGGTFGFNGSQSIIGLKGTDGTSLPTWTGSSTTGHCVDIDSTGSLQDAGGGCNGGLSGGTAGYLAVYIGSSGVQISPADIYLSAICGSTGSGYSDCPNYTDASYAIQAASGAAIATGSNYVIDDLCGTQTWSEQPFIFTGTGTHNFIGRYINRHNCVETILIDGIGTILQPSAHQVFGMGETGQASIAGRANTYIQACNPLIQTCQHGGYQVQHATISSISEPSSNTMRVFTTSNNGFNTCNSASTQTVCGGAGSGFSSTEVNVANSFQQYRIGYIYNANANALTTAGAWLYMDTWISNCTPNNLNGCTGGTNAQTFDFFVPTGTESCVSSCGALYLDTPIFDIGNGSGSPTIYFTGIDNMDIDCNYVIACGGFANGQGEENSFITNVQIWNADIYYGRLDSSTAYAGGTQGAVNSGPYGPWAGNIANVTCQISAGCPVNQTITGQTVSTGSNCSGGDAHTICLTAGPEWPPDIKTVTLTGAGCTTCTVSYVKSPTVIELITGNSPGNHTGIAATSTNPGRTAGTTVSGTAPSGATIGCGAGSASGPIYTINPDPCFNPNFVAFIFSGAGSAVGTGPVNRITASISDKSAGGGTGILQMNGYPSIPSHATAFEFIGSGGTVNDSHTEYFAQDADICGDALYHYTWYAAYNANNVVSGNPAGTANVHLPSGRWQYITPNNNTGIGIDIGAPLANCSGIDIGPMFSGNGNFGSSLVDNANGNTCADSVISYEIGNSTNPVIRNSCTTGHGPQTAVTGNFAATLTIGSGAGTGGSVGISCLSAGCFDGGGTVQVTTGTGSLLTASSIFTVTFGGTHKNGFCSYSPASTAAAVLSGSTQVTSISSNTTAILSSGSSALTGNTNYTWTYSCTFPN